MKLNEALREFGITPRELETRGLAAFREPGQLVVAEVGKDGRQHRLTPAASAAWEAMKDAAGHDGLAIIVQSAYRSVERQAEIIRAKLERGERIENIFRVSAPPGFSEHHTGRAVDVVTPECMRLERRFEETAAFRWLQDHARRFGFRLSYPPGNAQGYQYEPWHWCYKAPAE
jgi:zinc D-Ala-D-Ala carboxypeptidase